MSNIVTYFDEIKNISFEEMPFNKFDGMIFSRLSYIKFEKFIPKLFINHTNLVKFSKKFIKHHTINELSNANDFKILQLIATSKRYKNVFLKYYITSFDEEEEKQFSGSCFVIKKSLQNSIIFAFRGTDGTLAGWKEDFNMSYLDVIPAQEEAKLLINAFSKSHTKNVYICGHSKGGNLAVYAAKYYKHPELINNIFIYDSPGFNNNFYDDLFLNIKDKIDCYVPVGSIFGRLLTIQYKYSIVESKEKYLQQHDVYNWIIQNGNFIYVDSFSSISTKILDTINHYIDGMDVEKKKMIVDKLFSILEEAPGDPIKSLGEGFAAILPFISNLAKETFQDIKSNIKNIVKNIINKKR